MSNTRTCLPFVKGSDAEWQSFASLGGELAFGPLPAHWTEEVCSLTYSRISEDAAAPDVFRRVRDHHAEALWGLFERKDDAHRLIGYHAQLMLNADGHRALLQRVINRKDPDPSYLCNPGETPDAVYLWAVVAERKLEVFRAGLGQALAHYAGLPHYATLATEGGRKVGRIIGLRPVTPEDDRIGGLFIFRAGAAHQIPKSASPHIRMTTVTSAEQLEQVRAIRAVVFMGEQNCPYAEEFDGNDFCATHLLGFVAGEPAGTARIRYFHAFAKLERFCVLDRFRDSDLKFKMLEHIEELVRRKGFTTLYTHPQMRLKAFWNKAGYAEIFRNVEIRFSDHDYTEMSKQVTPHTDPISLRTDPMVIIRPEGNWDHPGILERSAERPVTRPC
jgi:predicted GNAT family N-acyltransferase